MKRTRTVGFAPLCFCLLGLACTKPSSPRVPSAQLDGLTRAFVKAEQAEQLQPPSQALEAYLALLDQGVASGQDGLYAVLAALDALVWRDTTGLNRIAAVHALSFRVPGGMAQVEQHLQASYAKYADAPPLTRALLAEAIVDFARVRGDAKQASVWRPRTGAVSRATVVGPLDWAPLVSMDRPTAMETPGVKIQQEYPGLPPFSNSLHPVVLQADGGAIDLSDANLQSGLYAAAVDVQVPRSERIWIALRSTASASVVVGGKVALVRPYSLGGQATLRFASAEVPAGRCRIVVRLGQNDDGGRMALWLLNDDGNPLEAQAPKVGDVAPVQAVRADPWELAPSSAQHRSSAQPSAQAVPLVAAALLAAGEARVARQTLEAMPARDAMSPPETLLFARSVMRSEDLPEVRKIERSRTAYDRVLARWPASWEALLGHVVLAAARKGSGEGRVESLHELENRPEHPVGALTQLREGQAQLVDPVVYAFKSATAMEAGLYDVAQSAFARVETTLAGTPLLAELDAKVHPRVGAQAEQFACATPTLDRHTLACLQQHVRRGDSAGVYAEIARLRTLRGSPHALWQQELGQKLADGDTPAVLSLYDALLPGQRTLGLLASATRSAPNEVRSRLPRDWLTARDSPSQIAPLLRLLGDDPAIAMEAEGLQAISEDRRSRAFPAAATLVLLHKENYTIHADGLLWMTLHDVRRVGGTTDVEQGAGGTTVTMVGREVRRTLRRRIHKKDGRILEPDRASFASQGNADLSQLEPGDYIEQIIEGWALPNRAGQLVLDTPDLLPERTSVRRASLEVRYPRSLQLTRWAHKLLGKPEERDEGPTHIVRYQLQDMPPRRLEEGVPRMEREVSMSVGTYTWPLIARHLEEQLRSLEEHDPFVAQWAHDALKSPGGEGLPSDKQAPSSPKRVQVERVVLAAGKAIRVANGSLLTDLNASLSSGPQQMTARHILELGQGSRTWVIHRALRELGIQAEIVVAEREPFSADPSYPPRPGRFNRPLVVAHLPSTEGGDVWVDADVEGPPLPAGHVSPELRGRIALRTNGQLLTIETTGEQPRDEVDVRLKVDDKGNANGDLTIVLSGRPAQGLADALEKVVGSERRNMLRNVVLGWLPWANVEDVALSSTEGSWQVAVRAHVSIPSYIQWEGKSWVLPGLEPLHSVFPRPAVSTLGSVYASRLGRQSALAIDTAFHYHVHRRVELPQTVKAPASLPTVMVKQDRLEASRIGAIKDGTLEEDFALALSTGTVSVDAYELFARDAKQVDDAFVAGMRLTSATHP